MIGLIDGGRMSSCDNHCIILDICTAPYMMLWEHEEEGTQVRQHTQPSSTDPYQFRHNDLVDRAEQRRLPAADLRGRVRTHHLA
eukprot:COSAG06_NODE_1108_length_10655_cov_33.558450_7_plen_84_part_00